MNPLPQRDASHRRDPRRRTRRRYVAVGAAMLMILTGPPEDRPDDSTEVPEHVRKTPPRTRNGGIRGGDSGGGPASDAGQPVPDLRGGTAPRGRALRDGRAEARPKAVAAASACCRGAASCRPTPPAGRWLVTAPVRIDDVVLRVTARRLASGGGIEVASQTALARDRRLLGPAPAAAAPVRARQPSRRTAGSRRGPCTPGRRAARVVPARTPRWCPSTAIPPPRRWGRWASANPQRSPTRSTAGRRVLRPAERRARGDSRLPRDHRRLAVPPDA